MASRDKAVVVNVVVVNVASADRIIIVIIIVVVIIITAIDYGCYLCRSSTPSMEDIRKVHVESDVFNENSIAFCRVSACRCRRR